MLVLSFTAKTQVLKNGFESLEYYTSLSIAFGKLDSLQNISQIPVPERYRMVYRSAVVGLDNRWSMWLRNDKKQAVISIRGTVATRPSWLANVYAAMLPATGSLKLNDSINFNYKLADDSRATVHTGWLISLGHMASGIENHILNQYEKGVKDFIVSGHSQGGAIAFLLTSYLHYRKKAGALPADIQLKTYCSAAPKPGNQFYSYDFDYINNGGWAFNVVNAADWVPETPFSIQQFQDLNTLNPFSDVKKSLRSQKYIIRVYANTVFNRLSKATAKAAKRYNNYLGKKTGKEVRKKLTQLDHGSFSAGLNYMPAGIRIVLMPDAEYYQQFPNDPKGKLGVWVHHSFDAYQYLLKKQFNHSN